ncbi:DUF1654 domain-containing protein [Stutzerimonas nosocomialis]|nr:DUF1654 domain-containing protein [Stutzerimonas nosocomialis]
MKRTQAQAITHQRQISGYSRLIRRVNRTLTTPRAQVERQANLCRQDGDHPEDWQRLVEEIEQTDGVAMTRRADGSIHVRWLSTDH